MTTTLPAGLVAGTYTVDPSHSRIGFVARHAMVTKVRGSFEEFEGSATVTPGDPQATRLSVAAHHARRYRAAGACVLRTDHCGTLGTDDIGRTVTLCGPSSSSQPSRPAMRSCCHCVAGAL